MVCNRCISAVEDVLESLNIDYKQIFLGEVILAESLSDSKKEALTAAVKKLGFEIISDKKSKTIEEIKKIIIDLVYHRNNDLKMNLSDLLSQELHHDYNYLSNLFSEIEGTTIEKYFIAQKIERVKELLVYDELSLSEIAILLNYSSVAYLSNQFKKITGLSPSHFKKIGQNRRKPIDKV